MSSCTCIEILCGLHSREIRFVPLFSYRHFGICTGTITYQEIRQLFSSFQHSIKHGMAPSPRPSRHGAEGGLSLMKFKDKDMSCCDANPFCKPGLVGASSSPTTLVNDYNPLAVLLVYGLWLKYNLVHAESVQGWASRRENTATHACRAGRGTRSPSSTGSPASTRIRGPSWSARASADGSCCTRPRAARRL